MSVVYVVRQWLDEETDIVLGVFASGDAAIAEVEARDRALRALAQQHGRPVLDVWHKPNWASDMLEEQDKRAGIVEAWSAYSNHGVYLVQACEVRV